MRCLFQIFTRFDNFCSGDHTNSWETPPQSSNDTLKGASDKQAKGEKWVKDMIRQLTEGKMQMFNKHKKRCSISLVQENAN